LDLTPFLQFNFFLRFKCFNTAIKAQLQIAAAFDLKYMGSTHENMLAAIDREIARLLHLKKSILEQQAREMEIKTMRERAGMFSDMLLKASSFRDTSDTLNYIKCFILPWKNYILECYFPRTFEALPEKLPDGWNPMESTILLMELSDALERDSNALASMQ